MRRRKTPAVLERAAHLGRVLFSSDGDMLREARRLQRESEPFSGVIYAHPVRVSIGRCVDDLELIASVYEPEECFRRVEYLPL